MVGWALRHGTRLGGGLYMVSSSSKYVPASSYRSSSAYPLYRAYQYAHNQSNGSQLKAILLARVVRGRSERMYNENHQKLAPAPGYDSVSLPPHIPPSREVTELLQAESSIPGTPSELVVYHEDAARPAFLLILE